MTFTRRALLLLLAPALLVVAVGLALPIAWLFRFSLMLSDTGMVTDRGPLIANYARLYGDGFHLWVFVKTLMLSLCVTLLALLLGYPLAHAI